LKYLCLLLIISDEDSLKKITVEFEERKNQLTLPVLGHYIAESGIEFPVDKKISNHCGMRCIMSCDKACDSFIEKDDECTLFSLAKTEWSKQPANYLLPRRNLDLKFMSLKKLYNDMEKLKTLGSEYLNGLDDLKKQCDDDGLVFDVSTTPKVLTIKKLEASQGCTFMFSNLKDDDKLVTMTLKKGFKLPKNAKLSVKTGTDDLLLCEKNGPLSALAEDDMECQWTAPLVTISIEYGDTAPDAALDKLIEIQKAA